jgi:hypothetical protein
VTHCAAAIEPQHERDVFEKEPAWSSLTSYEPEHVIDEPRSVARDACGAPSLAQVLAGKASSNYLGALRQGSQRGHVRVLIDIRKVVSQDRASGWIDLTEELGVPTMSRQADLESAHTGEQSDYRSHRDVASLTVDARRGIEIRTQATPSRNIDPNHDDGWAGQSTDPTRPAALPPCRALRVTNATRRGRARSSTIRQ